VKLQNKVALITGTSPNIGGGIALGLAAEGATVACVDVREELATHCGAHIGIRRVTGDRRYARCCI
jgi:NAD(P)-dependent dehydrogenase (short-subunit alcohol dehydrogenase family)